ncbi:PREDICTED: prolactin receptor isoform X1 [Cyprinodon variegatus]|uniref:Prolactin receptor n=2 Tax=Cyprinodon variegatus TaxID=28743 RepID=A0A3Q2EAM1_CYPVA|nr:PREDICTED: prolactin receptor isoform X1 [Cyprinodon variegatus]
MRLEMSSNRQQRLCVAMMRNVGGVIVLSLLLVFVQLAAGESFSPPGTPKNIICRSPEKETFTCWWEPGSDGGLPTTYALYYRKENSDTVYECPDYKTAGKNSCFFNKNDTSIWVTYNITVVATNALGRAFSDPVEIDVVYIVMPNPPEEVTVTVIEDTNWPFLRVSWEPPEKADTRSGWITLIYELRIKLENEDEWEVHPAGQQKVFNIFSLRPDSTYHVQVRCKPDHGFWSEWSGTTFVKVPDYFPRERSMWILIAVFAAFIILTFTFIWLSYMKIHNLKHYVLPPVPGPKIKGFDKKALKNGKFEDIFSSLVVSDFPPTTSNYEDFIVENLEVFVPEEQELIMEDSKDLQDDSIKSENSTCDNDSGRGSCDSHTLLIDKGGGDKEEALQSDQEGSQDERVPTSPEEVMEEDLLACCDEKNSPDISEKVKFTPSLISPLPRYNLMNQPNPPEIGKKHCLSDSLLNPDSLPSYFTQPPSTKNDFRSNPWECNFNHKQHPLHPQTTGKEHLQVQNEISWVHVDRTEASLGVQAPSVRSTEYVEVQRVSGGNMVLLHPVSAGQENSGTMSHQTEHYSRVKTVNNDSGLLLLQKESTGEEMGICLSEEEVESRATSNGYTASITPTSEKPMVGINSTLPILDDRMASGYVDTATMFGLPTY